MQAVSFLEKIIADKRLRLDAAKASKSLEEMRAQAFEARRDATPHALRAALERTDRFNVIAEFKRASPSKGVIRHDAEPASLARAYERGGAAGLSVLTEEDHFRGSLEDLREARRAVRLPVLRKDFVFDEYQVYEAAEAGADALLLIVAALAPPTLARLRRLAEDELRMDALVEVHTEDEMRAADESGARLVGVNNRDLRSFEVSLEVSRRLAAHAAPGALLVSESGLRDGADLRDLRAHGYRGFLVGETLMRAERPDEALRALLDSAE
ncbi:MAG TPA: indole-3-glycerol phosphate synthase TrpC [Pyrinomonadaceae bacterium]|nr:indole-3-glycerol phosphate synthase TrpC [Pyrinomonadaceae bacterium]